MPSPSQQKRQSAGCSHDSRGPATVCPLLRSPTEDSNDPTDALRSVALRLHCSGQLSGPGWPPGPAVARGPRRCRGRAADPLGTKSRRCARTRQGRGAPASACGQHGRRECQRPHRSRRVPRSQVRGRDAQLRVCGREPVSPQSARLRRRRSTHSVPSTGLLHVRRTHGPRTGAVRATARRWGTRGPAPRRDPARWQQSVGPVAEF
jgi:hypothetical protein